MRNGRTFPYRPRRVDTSGDGEGQARGVLDAPVKAGRPGAGEARLPQRPRSETKRLARSRRSHAPQKNRAAERRGRPYQNRHRWAATRLPRPWDSPGKNTGVGCHYNGILLNHKKEQNYGRRSLAGCSPWGREESDTTERLHFYFSLSCIGEGNGSPLQCSCLENPRDGGAWWPPSVGSQDRKSVV